MKVVTSASEMKRLSETARKKGQKVVFVPTMGSLHEGHLSLFREGKRRGGLLVVSIFVNPIQFDNPQDFEKYPRDLEGDLKKCGVEGVDIVFTPEKEEIYPSNEKEPEIQLPPVARRLEGVSRPGHFQGVVAVVSKLFQIVRPDFAFFGMKDYQQLRVIQEMVKGQGIDVEIVPCPTVRSKEGLALSSRNSRLSSKGLQQALLLSQSLKAAETLFQKGERGAKKIADSVREKLSQGKEIRIDYVEVVDAETLEGIQEIKKPSLVALAAFIEGVRLIDNCVLGVTHVTKRST